MHFTVADRPDSNRFVALTDDDEVAGLIDYERRDEAVVLVHTEVEVQGQGVGSLLVRGTFDLMRERGVPVIVECPFIQRFLSRHEGEYDDVVVAS